MAVRVRVPPPALEEQGRIFNCINIRSDRWGDSGLGSDRLPATPSCTGLLHTENPSGHSQSVCRPGSIEPHLRPYSPILAHYDHYSAHILLRLPEYLISFKILSLREWRNWQTRWVQDPVGLVPVWVRVPPPAFAPRLDRSGQFTSGSLFQTHNR